MNCETCNIGFEPVRGAKGRFCNKKCYWVSLKGIAPPYINPKKTLEHRRKISQAKRKDGWIDKKGYKRHSINGKDYKEHHIVYFKENPFGHFFIPEGWVIHHINGKKLDNRIENLCLMPHGEHSRLHHMVQRGEAELIQT